MSRSLFTLAACLLLAAVTIVPAPCRAQEEEDPFENLLFAPELVFQHQKAIGLSADQRKELIAEVTQAQADFLPAQLELAGDMEELQELLAETRIDEQAAMAIAIRLLDLENQVKKRHLALAIRIKNLLSREQQRRLEALREAG